MIRQKMDSLSFELLAHMMTRMTHWLDSHDSLARWLAVCQDPQVDRLGNIIIYYNTMQKKYPSVIFSTQTAILWVDLVVLCSPIFSLLHNI